MHSKWHELSSSDGTIVHDNDDSRLNSPRVENGHRKSRVIKRSLVVGGHKTSVSLEDAFWNELRAIAHRRRVHLSQLVGFIDSQRQHCNLSSAIRLFVFDECKARSSAGGPFPAV